MGLRMSNSVTALARGERYCFLSLSLDSAVGSSPTDAPAEVTDHQRASGLALVTAQGSQAKFKAKEVPARAEP
jgi:hypothetical protein